MNQASEDHPTRCATLAQRLSSLQVVLDLCEVSVWVAVIHQSVEELHRLPDAHFHLVELAVLGLHLKHILVSLLLVVLTVELAHGRTGVLLIITVLVLEEKRKKKSSQFKIAIKL